MVCAFDIVSVLDTVRIRHLLILYWCISIQHLQFWHTIIMQIHLPCFVILDGYRLNLKLTAADLLFLLHFDNFDKKC